MDSTFTAAAGGLKVEVKEEMMEEVEEVKGEVEEESNEVSRSVDYCIPSFPLVPKEAMREEEGEMKVIMVEEIKKEIMEEIDEEAGEIDMEDNEECIDEVIEFKTEIKREVDDEYEEVSTTPQCVLCEKYPATVSGYVSHFQIHHKTTLKANGIYLICSCGLKVRYRKADLMHISKCEGNQFTLHKLDNNSLPSPQCFLCDAYPTTACGYLQHLQRQHKTTVIANGIYLLCVCGHEFRSTHGSTNHSKDCDGLQFTLHKYAEKPPARPSTKPPAQPCLQCFLCEMHPKTSYGYYDHLIKYHKFTLIDNGMFILCSCGHEIRSRATSSNHKKEIYPKTANEYAKHLYKKHKSTLISNGVYLICSCDREVRCATRDANHGKTCDSEQFALHKLDENYQRKFAGRQVDVAPPNE